MSTQGAADDVPPRKRTARACAHCRRRKSKCDGQDPCSQCSAIGLHCSYEVNVKQETGLRYVAKLERKIESLERTLADREEKLLANSSAGTSTTADTRKTSVSPIPTVAAGDQGWPTSSAASRSLIDSTLPQFGSTISSRSTAWPIDDQSESHVDTINFDLKSTSRHGTATGLGVLGLTFSASCKNMNVGIAGTSSQLIEAIDCPVPLQMSRSTRFDSPFLPPKQELLECVDVALREAFHLWPFLNRAHLDLHIHRLYNTQLFGQTKIDWDDLALIYSVLALGKRFGSRSPSAQPVVPGQIAEIKGLDWIQAARAIVEPNICNRSILALQTVLCMAIFLSSYKALTQCAELLAHAATAAIRMGLHESLHSVQYAKEERICRQRTYLALRALDSYVSGILGLPRNLRMVGGHDGIQIDTMAVDRESFVASDAYLELREIIGDAEDRFYFNGRMIKGRGSYSVPYSRIQELDADLEQWYRARTEYALWSAPSRESTRAQLHLRYAYYHVQMMTYLPFLHHIIQSNVDENVAVFDCCRKCVHGAMMAVQTAEMLDEFGCFNDAYPLTLQVLAFAATALLVAELGVAEPKLVQRAQNGSRRARSLLNKLSKSSVAGAQLLSPLQTMYNRAAMRTQTNIVTSEYPKMSPYSSLWSDTDFEGPD